MADRERRKLSNEELVRLLADDLDTHFEVLFDTYAQPLYSLVYRMLLGGKKFDSNDESADIVQRTMIKAYFALKGFSRERILDLKLSPWLKTIAMHEAQRSLRSSLVDVESQLLTEDGRSIFENIQDDLGLTPETLVERAEIIKQIEEEIHRLPSIYKDGILKHYIEGWTEEAIAREQGISLNTIKSRIRRAKILLQAKLKRLREEGR